MVTKERARPSFIVCLGRWQVAPQLREVASHVRRIRPGLPKRPPFTKKGRRVLYDVRKLDAWMEERE